MRFILPAMWLTLVTGSSACHAARDGHVVDQADAVRQVADKVHAALKALNSLSLTVDYNETVSGTLGHVSTNGRYKLRVIMARDGRFRAEAMGDDGEAIALRIFDGKTHTAWSAWQNAWTRAPARPDGSAPTAPGALVAGVPVFAYHCQWLGDSADVFGFSPDPSGKTRASRHADVQTLDGRPCDHIMFKTTVPMEPPRSIPMRDEWWFDAKTYLPVKQMTTMKPKVFYFTVGEQKRVIKYRHLRLNIPISDKMFSFTPPEGAEFIPPDDPRFRRSVPIGRPAPRLALPAVDGRTVQIRDYVGKKAVLLSFWSTTCAPCLREMPTLCKLHDEFDKKGLAVVGVSLGGKVNRLKSFLKKRPVPYTVLHDSGNASKRLYYVGSIPHTLLIDKKGIVVRVWQGWDSESEEKEIRGAIAKLGIHR